MDQKKFLGTIPQKRGNSTEWALAIISTAIVLVGSHYASNSFLYILLTFSLYYLIIAAVEFIFRVCSIWEEQKHIMSRYQASRITLFRDVFYFSNLYWVLVMLPLFILVYVHYEYGVHPLKLLHDFGFIPNICSCIGIFLASRLFMLDFGPLHESILIAKLNGLDYGSAMAYSFFHGFLQIVLPHRGTEQKGIKELMEDFESSENITFEIHKLLILIPLSLYCPTSLVDVSEMVELCKSLPDIKLTRAGVRERVYKNTAYKIKKKYYVCAEYATPLQTLHDIVKHNNRHANHYKKHSRDLVLHFYLTLQTILKENPDCGNFCELIFFDDMDSSGTRIDVGTVILNYLKRLKKAERRRSTMKHD